ncbi:hypothetical protein HG530_003302 [Fusarium avenaceum]|nr:hypothetical protein HG530_003302 [Fusarium avenaceum]
MFGNSAQKLLVRQPLAREQPVGISVGTIAENSDNGVTLAQLLSNLFGGNNVQRGTGAQVQALLIQTARAIDQINIRLEVVGNATLSDTLGDAGTRTLVELTPRGDEGVKDTARRIGEEALHSAVGNILQVSRGTSQGSTSTSSASARPADMGEADTGVSSGTLDDSATGLEKAALLSILDNIQSCTILDRTTRVHELGLTKDLTAGLLGETVKTNERSVSDSCNRSS